MANMFPPEDLRSISNILYEPKVELLRHREVFSLDESHDPDALQVGFDVYDRTGSAKIFAGRANAKDIPKVGDKKERFVQGTYEIATEIEYLRAELSAAAGARRLGNGPSVQLDQLRPATARRFIFEQESIVAWTGDANLGIRGLFHDDFYGNDSSKLGTKEFARPGATGGTAIEKRLWKNKSSQEILDDVTRGIEVVEDGDIFSARTLIIPSKQRTRLRKPFGSDTATTLFKFIMGEGDYFDNVIADNRLKAGNNGDTVDYGVIIDNNPEVVQLALLQDIFMFDPFFDKVGNSEQVVTLVTGGIELRHPTAVYIMKGI